MMLVLEFSMWSKRHEDLNTPLNLTTHLYILYASANPSKYRSIRTRFVELVNKHGVGALFTGWLPTLLGYNVQGALKFGFYEFFKLLYSDMLGPKKAEERRTLIYLAGSASAEFIADIALCPFEAVKVRVQTQPHFTKSFYLMAES